MPALRNGAYAKTDLFEKHHGPNKGLCKGSKSGKGGTGGEGNAMKWSTRRLCIQFMMQGLTWGRNGEHTLSLQLTQLRNPKPGLIHRPHPVLESLRISNAKSSGEAETILGAGGWAPGTVVPHILDSGQIQQMLYSIKLTSLRIWSWAPHSHFRTSLV